MEQLSDRIGNRTLDAAVTTPNPKHRGRYVSLPVPNSAITGSSAKRGATTGHPAGKIQLQDVPGSDEFPTPLLDDLRDRADQVAVHFAAPPPFSDVPAHRTVIFCHPARSSTPSKNNKIAMCCDW
ncbi:hypothetical protein [[Kitasatospora] papulosa]|uniref:hypothetical protein n=1 Tax=[Kitasatospora] papulosa TaxID=1464011 RepID=UPI0036BE0B7F